MKEVSQRDFEEKKNSESDDFGVSEKVSKKIALKKKL
jgi:hypothetical protein